MADADEGFFTTLMQAVRNINPYVHTHTHLNTIQRENVHK